MPFGGPDYNPYILLEIHYDNSKLISGETDSSGFKFIYTQNLRKHDAGVFEVGLEYTNKMAIPPGQAEFKLNGYCIAECTDVALPAEGITILGSQLHTHERGLTGGHKLAFPS